MAATNGVDWLGWGSPFLESWPDKDMSKTSQKQAANKDGLVGGG